MNVHSAIYILIMVLAATMAYGMWDLYRRLDIIREMLDDVLKALKISGDIMEIFNDRLDNVEGNRDDE